MIAVTTPATSAAQPRSAASVVLSADEAVALIQDGQTLAIGGSGGGLLEPGALLEALGRAYQENGHPRDLTLLHATGIGDRQGSGLGHLAHRGLARRVVAGNWGNAPGMGELALANELEAYNFPQGVMSQMFREVAAGRPGVITHVGIGTFCDPRLEGGKLNDAAVEDLVSVIEIDGREWLHYRPIPPDVSFIRGTAADEDGNISFEHEAAKLEMLAMAQATRNNGGIVIAQVKRQVARGAIDAKHVLVPGICVDVVVVVPEQRQLDSVEYDPALSGETRVLPSAIPPMPFDQRKVVARRALREVATGDVVNLGVGIADGVASVAAEQGWIQRFTCTIEQGIIGGIPARGIDFGVATNPQAMVDQPSQFDFYDGGGIDIAFLGFAQVDRHGNVNVSKFSGRVVGTGGFVNISQNAGTVVFCGTFTAGGLAARPVDGRLDIEQEGRFRKFVRDVEQVTYSGIEGARRGQRVLYVTERAVFTLRPTGLVLIEVAPGIDLQRDVLDQLDWDVQVDP
ncbi:acyl CoA:acetate/3-ketoacid CoA transferase, partial [Pseudactinotalea sp.]|uniref:acyl CoA:acetate/3-ketoacid CoA transferase n=1 Tax=Pseudactinotalea sp. TaxID=1926260 RepID=UPI003B3B6BA9